MNAIGVHFVETGRVVYLVEKPYLNLYKELAVRRSNGVPGEDKTLES